MGLDVVGVGCGSGDGDRILRISQILQITRTAVTELYNVLRHRRTIDVADQRPTSRRPPLIAQDMSSARDAGVGVGGVRRSGMGRGGVGGKGVRNGDG